MEPSLLAAMRKLMFPGAAHQQTEEDISRWHQQGFVFSQTEETSVALVQSQGGPCGVLASVQAFTLACLAANNQDLTSLPDGGGTLLDPLRPPPGKREEALACAMLEMLKQAASSNTITVVTLQDQTTPLTLQSPASNLAAQNFDVVHNREAAKTFLLDHMSHFSSPCGVVLFLFSIIATRTPQTTRQDMDDEEGALTGQFGYCTQELLNLLITGRAVSQVHDGEKLLGDSGLKLTGIMERPLIGYLTLLEAMQYCEVGSFYKSPKLPFWIVGSDSHYTVLFSTDPNVVLKEQGNPDTAVARRAFNAQDRQENGFIPQNAVATVITSLELDDEVSNAGGLAAVEARMAMPGAGIVLWESFWDQVRPLMAAKRRRTEASTRVRSDSDVARELATELNDDSGNGTGNGQWQCIACTYINTAPQYVNCEVCSTPKPSNSNTQQATSMDVDDDGQIESKSFDLIHLNGLVSKVQGESVGPTIVKFSLTTVDPVLAPPMSGGHGQAIEEVLHTKWKGAIIDWPEGSLPNIHG